MCADDNKRLVVEQFTQQATLFREFAEMPGQPREIVLAATEIKPDDTVLDVACGPGVTTCDLADVAQHATGINISPAMIEQAKKLQQEKGFPKKQRHTARRIFQRLREEGYTGGYTQVKQAVREIKQRSREAFVPLIHRPGEAQADFGFALVKVAVQTSRPSFVARSGSLPSAVSSLSPRVAEQAS